jgi:restriction system protein
MRLITWPPSFGSHRRSANTLASRTQPVFDNRVGWAPDVSGQSGPTDITTESVTLHHRPGRDVLQRNPNKLDAAFLRANFQNFCNFRNPAQTPGVPTPEEAETPGGVA